MKKLLLILCTLFLCAGAFSEIKFNSAEENEKNLQIMFRNQPDFIEEAQLQMLMGATCDTLEEVQKLVKKNRLNLNDYFVKYLTNDEVIETPYYYVCNLFFGASGEYCYWIYYLYDKVEEFYSIEY